MQDQPERNVETTQQNQAHDTVAFLHIWLLLSD
jgi:hypothetical protein